MISPALLSELQQAEAIDQEPRETTLNSPFLHLIASAERGRLSRSVGERTCSPGEIVFREGDLGEAMYLVWSGRAAIVKGDMDNEVVLAFRRAGEIFGEMALLENQPRSATVVALDHLRLLEIHRNRFEQLLVDAPDVSRSIMEILSARLRRMSNERGLGELSEKRLSRQVMDLETEKKRLEELQRLRLETTDLIIHDLRNPLGAIAVALRMLQMLLPADVLEANHEMLTIAQSSCDRMQRLVDSLLEVSRMEQDELPFSMSDIDLQAMIADLVRRTVVLSRPEVTFHTDLPPDLPHVRGDAEKIERVLMNLIDNALKYSPENGRIELAAVALADGVQFSISDDGPGIPPEERERIFERFAQISNRLSRRRGLGLGLTFCRLVIERHGGRIWVESKRDGAGSRFVFMLPW